MKKNFSLKIKFAGIIVFIVLFSGLTTIFIVDSLFSNMLREELKKKGLAISQVISAHSVNLVLTENILALNDMLSSEQKADEDIAYAFIEDIKGTILSHTFKDGFPKGLRQADRITDNPYNIRLMDAQGSYIWDISFPIKIKDEQIGVARVGLTEARINQEINRGLLIIGAIKTVLAVLSFLIAYILLRTVLLKPVRKLYSAIKEVKNGNLTARADVTTGDEIEYFAVSFNEMAENLQKLYLGLEKTIDERTMTLRQQGQELDSQFLALQEAQIDLEQTKVYLENLLNYANAPIIVWDPAYRVTIFNKAFERLTGIKSEKVIGFELEKVFSFRNKEQLMLLSRENITGKSQKTVEIPIRSANGNIHTLLWSVATIYSKDNEYPISTIAQGQDITLLKEAEKERNEAYEKLKELQSHLVQSEKMAAIGQLAGGVAHEINNPLTGVLNNVQLVKMLWEQNKNFSNEECKELLNIIEESAMRCKKITGSLLDFSRASTGQFSKLSLNLVIDNVNSLIANEMKLQNILIKNDLQENLPEVKGDTQLLQQILVNLLSNAQWAIAQKLGNLGGIITVKTEYIPKSTFVNLYISDNGIGIPKEKMGKIFEPFFTTKQVGEGTGLGLSVVYNIIRRHKGNIEVESLEGQGTTFKIALPAAL